MRRRIVTKTELVDSTYKVDTGLPLRSHAASKEVLVSGSKDARLMSRAREACMLLRRCESILKSLPQPTSEEKRLIYDLTDLIDYVEVG